MYTEKTITIWQVIGMPMCVLSVVTFLVLLLLFIVGINARFRKRDAFSFSWWIMSLSVWIFVAGMTVSAGHLMDAFAKLGDVALPPEIFNRLLAESFARIFIGSLVAFFGLSLRMLLGVPKQSGKMENRQPPVAS